MHNENIFVKFWMSCKSRHPGIAQFFVFFMVCNGVTVLQLIMMPLFKWLFGLTPLVQENFRIWHTGTNPDGSPYYIFDYAAGSISSGGGGGLAYFLAVEITMGIAQVINFITQRDITFKATGSIVKSAFWYVLAYIVITLGTAALQGVIKVPVYTFCMGKMGTTAGTTVADIIIMLINCAVSFWVFFPIMKFIFKN